MEIKDRKGMEDALCDLVAEFVNGKYEETDGVRVCVVDDDTVTLEVVKDIDESEEDDDVYPFACFASYAMDEEAGMTMCIDADYVGDVASGYFGE